jgi:diamine N-acetyltransferase
MSKEITVKVAAPEDARLISAVATVSFYEAYFEQDDPHTLADYLAETFSEAAIAADLASPDNTYLIARSRGRVVGYAKLRDAETHESVRSDKAIEIQRFYLIERVWGKGVGDVLLDECIAHARSIGKNVLWLGVWEENMRGQSFYNRRGFKQVGTVLFPYGENDSGTSFVMQLEI